MKTLVCVIAALVISAVPLSADDDAGYRKIENQLETTKITTFAYEGADVKDVVKDIAKQARINIVFDKKALDGVDADDRKITLELVNVKASNALNIVLDQIKLKTSFKHGVLYITSEEKAEEATILKVYDIRDITVKIRNFPAPKLRLRGEDDARGPIIDYGDEEDDPETDDVIEIIEDAIDADWGGKASIREVKGQLVVRAPRKVHEEVAGLLNKLRAAK